MLPPLLANLRTFILAFDNAFPLLAAIAAQLVIAYPVVHIGEGNIARSMPLVFAIETR